MKTRTLICGTFAILFAATAANAAQFVVVDARGVSLKQGTMLDAGKPLVLKQGQHVTLISDSGVTLKIDGPYNKAPAVDQGSGTTLVAAMQGLATERNARLTDVGATRGVAPAAPLPGPWLLDATRSANACLQQGHQPVFWRPQTSAAVALSIIPADQSWKADANWAPGEDRISVRDQVVMHGEATYYVSMNGNRSAISIATVPASLPNDDVRAAWMAQKGCEQQAEALLRTRR
ncbi:MAG TPA: hypothetical protein VH000_07140 [Rhizomicrobium sp.]|jgi:hypothetical protein|nr:hypothetical protein [Rhizomicrobium sp.]HEX4533988.1 hypothetical protein [Rhizomicrobium sp.]